MDSGFPRMEPADVNWHLEFRPLFLFPFSAGCRLRRSVLALHWMNRYQACGRFPWVVSALCLFITVILLTIAAYPLGSHSSRSWISGGSWAQNTLTAVSAFHHGSVGIPCQTLREPLPWYVWNSASTLQFFVHSLMRAAPPLHDSSRCTQDASRSARRVR